MRWNVGQSCFRPMNSNEARFLDAPIEPTHVWRLKARLPERKGQGCRVVARGRLNSCLVEFADGTRVITSRWAVRKIVA
jgi:hypothetical protein